MSADPKVAHDDDIVGRGPKRRRTTNLTLGEEFDPRNNALNAWRLTLATGVILWHSWPLTGRQVSSEPIHQLLRDGWVDGFFAISGFLITWSWFRRPRVRDYLVARGLRILPGLWACLIVTALIIAPIALAIQGGSAARLLLSRAPFEYVLGNSAVLLREYDVGGTPHGIPWSGDWNGSLWTLFWEALCYIAIAGLGVVGLLRRRWLIPALLALVLYWSAKLPPYTGFIEAAPGARQHIDAATAKLVMDGIAARFALMFLAGALLYRFRNVIPARWSLVVVSLVIVGAASLLPNYRVVGAIPLAYAIIVSGALIHNKRLRLRTDFSYGVYIYAFPMQQLLVICGLAFLNPIVFAIIAAIATLPLAALSWFVVEKPAISLKSRLKRRSIAATAERQPG
jgi:peptidoglycan/LPS O-acetylase OafA/YrhL